MSDKFLNKYRIPSARMQNWDYGSNALYFVTICTANREYYFGEIQPQMELSEIGELANRFWNEIPNHFPFVKLGEFVVMPNHVHGIIIIDKPLNTQVETPKLGVSTTTTATNINRQRTINASEKWNPETLGVIINQYKRMVTINAHKINANFKWQSRFHDHIIRDNAEHQRISGYITNNPANWKDDKFFAL